MPGKLKRLIRARRNKTGESHQTALRHIRANIPDWNTRLGVEPLRELAAQALPQMLATSNGVFDKEPFVLVAADVAVPLGKTFAVAVQGDPSLDPPEQSRHLQRASRELDKEIARRRARNENSPAAILLTSRDVVGILQHASAPEQIEATVSLTARFTTNPPPGYGHVLIVTEGEVLATLCPTLRPTQ